MDRVICTVDDFPNVTGIKKGDILRVRDAREVPLIGTCYSFENHPESVYYDSRGFEEYDMGFVYALIKKL